MIQNSFSWVDYVVFGSMLAISLTIGIVFGIKNRKKKSTKDFLLGGGDLKVLPVGFSILAGFISAIAILGFSGEMYKYGTMYWMIILSYFTSHLLIAIVYIPFYHQLNITSAYEYLELRFHPILRSCCSIIFFLQMFLYMGVALYTPALAIEQVTGLPLIQSICITGVICSIYTVIGGLKATVWIDTFQIMIMFAGLIILLIKGTIDIGGFGKVWSRAQDAHRIEFFNFDPNPFERHTFWTLFVGGFFTNLSMYGANQGSVQRYLSVKNWKNASKAMMVSLAGMCSVLTLTCLCGLLAFAFYYDCDLLSAKKITRSEQILPYLVLQVLGSVPGLPGLFVAAVYAAALSSISGAMSSLSAISITDFIKPLYLIIKKEELKESIAGPLTKVIALVIGIAGIFLAYFCQYLPNTVLQIALSIFGLLGGPILAVISLGMFVPYANWAGAFVGLLTSVGINLWLGIAGVYYGKRSVEKPMSTSGCPNSTSTLPEGLIYYSTKALEPYHGLYVYQLSYLHYSTLAILIVFSVGILVSFITYDLGIIKKQNLNKKYYFRYFRKAESEENPMKINKSNNFLLKNVTEF